MTGPQEKWRANADKVTFAKQFPGLLSDWTAAAGKRIASVTPIEGRSGRVILFDDHTFLVAGPLDPEPADLLAGIFAAADTLRRWYPDAMATLQTLQAEDARLTKEARQEKILGAIRNNARELPGLKDAVAKLLDEL